MQLPKILFVIGFVFITSVVTYALVFGDFFGEARVLFKYPWFNASLADLYSGLSLFSGWVVYREKSGPRSLVWIFLFITLGNIATFAYAFMAATQSRGDWNQFWLGKRATAH